MALAAATSPTRRPSRSATPLRGDLAVAVGGRPVDGGGPVDARRPGPSSSGSRTGGPSWSTARGCRRRWSSSRPTRGRDRRRRSRPPPRRGRRARPPRWPDRSGRPPRRGPGCGQARVLGVGRAQPGGGDRAPRPGARGRRRSSRVVVAWAMRPSSTTTRRRTWSSSLAMFWWMRLLAKRVRALVPWPQVTSASARSPTSSSTRSQVAKPRCAIASAVGSHAISAPPPGRSVKRAGTDGWPVWPTWIGWPLPQFAVPQNTHSSGPPTMSIDAQNRGPMPGVGGVAEHLAELAVLDLPGDLAAELEVEALVVDRPGAVGVHVDAVVGGGDHLLEAAVAGEQADVGHPHHRQPGGAVGAHHAARRRGPTSGAESRPDSTPTQVPSLTMSTACAGTPSSS